MNLKEQIQNKIKKYDTIHEQIKLWTYQNDALQKEISELEVELDSQNDNETVLCEACGKSAECEQFTHIDDGDYLFCVVCWEQIQDKINVGSDNDFQLKDGCKLELKAYDNQTLKTLKKVQSLSKKLVCPNCQVSKE